MRSVLPEARRIHALRPVQGLVARQLQSAARSESSRSQAYVPGHGEIFELARGTGAKDEVTTELERTLRAWGRAVSP